VANVHWETNPVRSAPEPEPEGSEPFDRVGFIVVCVADLVMWGIVWMIVRSLYGN
jgi:hypothetical protein